MEEECLSEFDRTHHPALQRTAPGVTLDKENERQAANSRQGQIRSAEPAFIEPMQCKPVTALAAGEKWTFEIKFDGYRCIAVKHGKEATLFSRHEKVLNRRFPNVVNALASLEGDFVLDGELVALDPEGRPSFQMLQDSLSQSLPIHFYALIY
jgi:ATP-dependent DNA ligase